MVLVVGSVNRDLFAHVDRFPGPGETVLSAVVGPASLGGKGANQAVAAARLGARVEIVGAVGSADLATTRGLFRAYGVGTTWLDGVAGATGWAHVLIGPSGDNMIIVDPGANTTLTVSRVDEAVRKARPVVVLTQCEIGVDAAAQAVSSGRAVGARTICNVSPAVDLAALGGANVDVLIVNRSEAEQLTGRAEPDSAAGALASQTGGTAIVTIGAGGAVVSSAGHTRQLPAARAPVVRDTTGAGDVFAGAIACAIARGDSLEAAIDLAQRAAAWVVGRVGTVGPLRADV